jgi:hypothetical protein
MRTDTEVSPTPQATLTTNRLIAAGPVLAIIVPLAITIPIVLPEPLAGDLRHQYDAMASDHVRMGFKHFAFDEWVIERLKDIAYGPGEMPEARG